MLKSMRFAGGIGRRYDVTHVIGAGSIVARESKSKPFIKDYPRPRIRRNSGKS